jgi:hypothetical protein
MGLDDAIGGIGLEVGAAVDPEWLRVAAGALLAADTATTTCRLTSPTHSSALLASLVPGQIASARTKFGCKRRGPAARLWAGKQ